MPTDSWAAIILVVAACAPAARVHVEETVERRLEASLDTVEFEMPSGLAAVLLPDPDAGMVEVDVRIHAGSRDDPPGRAGLAHLAAHLVFGQRFAVPGAATSATVSITEESTHFSALGRPETFADLMALQAGRLLASCDSLSPEILERERAAVLAELNAPGRALAADLRRALYPEGHPYRHLPTGVADELARVTRDDVCAFVRDHYAPDRALVVVAGAVDGAQVNAALASFAGVARAVGVPRPPVPAVAPAARDLVIEADIDRPIVIAAWPVARHQLEAEDIAHVGLEQMVSAMRASFRPEAHGVSIVSGGIRRFVAQYRAPDSRAVGGDGAPFVLIGMASDGDEAGWRWTQHFMLDALPAGFVGSAAQSAALRASLNTRVLEQLQSVGGRARAIADWRQFVAPGAMIADILGRVDHYDDAFGLIGDALPRDRLTWIVLKPAARPSPTPATASLPDLDGEAGELLAVDATEADGALQAPAHLHGIAAAERVTLANGLRVLFVPRRDAPPLASVVLAFAGGSAREPRDEPGLASLAAELLSSGTSGGNPWPKPFALGSSTGADESFFTAEGFDGRLDAMLTALANRIEGGGYFEVGASGDPAARVMRWRAIVAARAALFAALFGGGHPYASPGWFSEALASGITRGGLDRFRKAHFVARNGVLVVAGNFDLAAAKASVARLFGDLPAGRAAPPIAPPLASAGASNVGIVDEGSAQAIAVSVAWRAADAELPARLVAAEVLRERMRLAGELLDSRDGIDAGLERWSQAAAYVVDGNVPARKAGEALLTIRSKVAALRADPVAPESFVSARRAAVARLLATATDQGRTSLAIARVMLRGGAPDELDVLAVRVAAVEPAQVAAVLAADLAAGREVVVLRGPRALMAAAFAAAGIAHPVLREEN